MLKKLRSIDILKIKSIGKFDSLLESALVRYKVSCKKPMFNCWSYCSGEKNVQGINKMGKQTVFKHVSSYTFLTCFIISKYS